MIFMQPIPKKNFHFFYRTQKVSTVISYKKFFSGKGEGLGKHDPALTAQKKQTQNKPQYLKSLIFKDFEDYIFNIAIRISISLLVYIFCECGSCEGRRRGLFPEKILYPTGDSRQYPEMI